METDSDDPRDIFCVKEEYYECEQCDFRTKQSDMLRKHKVNKHGTNEWFECEHCDHQARTQKAVQKHVKEAHANQVKWFTCKFCEFKTISKRSFTMHKIGKHGNERLVEWFKCKYCNYRTNKQIHVLRHEKGMHTENDEQKTVYKCHICSLETVWKHCLRRHMQTHERRKDVATVDPLRCDDGPPKITSPNRPRLCKSKMATGIIDSPGSKMADVKRKAREVYRCDECAFKTVYRRNVMRHKEAMHQAEATMPKLECEEPSKEKPQVKKLDDEMKKCKEELTNGVEIEPFRKLRSLLKVESVRDANGEWFECKKCNYRTNWKTGLQRHHMFTHGEEGD